MQDPPPGPDRPPPSGGRDGARRRRRGLYGPPPRLTLTSPLVGRLVWAIGDWGRASEHIGQRWEQVAPELVRPRLDVHQELIVLASDPPLMAEVLASNLPHADALRAFRVDGSLGLEPLDFKWSLETASVKQVSGDTFTQLLAAATPLLGERLRAARHTAGLPQDAPLELVDGRFLAPDHPANRAAVRDDPHLPRLVLPVDPQAFFRPLAAWDAAVALARIEGVALERLTSLEAVERYYRLGAGAQGALTRLATPLFETALPAGFDVLRAIEGVRTGGRAITLNALLVHLGRQLAVRREQEDRVNAIPRLAYPFGRLRADLARLGVPRAVLESRGAIGRLHGEAVRELTAAVRTAGRDLVAEGTDVEEALARLADQQDHWSALGRRTTARLAERLNTRPEM